jgi:glycosyltransferase involved in cell wall biosynthesis
MASMPQGEVAVTRRHLLVVAHAGGRGGAEHCLDTTLEHLDQTKWQLSALFPTNGAMVESAKAHGATVVVQRHVWWMAFEPSFWYARQLLALPYRVIKLARWIRRHGVALVYSNTAVIPEGALAARLAKVPHVWHVHEVLTPAHWRPRLLPMGVLTRLIGRLSRRVVFESASARAVAGRAVPEAKARVIANSLRTLPSGAGASRDDVRRELEIAPSDFVVLWIGRFSERKRPQLLVEALARMSHANMTTALFVGEGPIRDDLENHRLRLGIPELRARVLPFRDDLAPLFRAGDVLVLTSDEESFGLVLIEAGAAGLPVIATRAQGPSEIVVDADTGFLVDLGDAAALAERLDQLAQDAALRGRLGAAGAARVASEYSARRNTERLERVFQEALGEPAERPAPTEGGVTGD